MRHLLQNASRSIFANATLIAPNHAARPFVRSVTRSVPTPSICAQQQYRAFVGITGNLRGRLCPQPSNAPRRRFHQTPNDERRPPDEKVPTTGPSADRNRTPDVIELPSESNVEPPIADTRPIQKQDGKADAIASVPAEDLPSHREAQRWDFSKRLTELMDEVLPKLAVVTHKVNTLTGTDYSGIEALKREIKEHENLVKTRRTDIEGAKQALDAAMAQQASSQKEVVALLERKHSWSAGDLERYMSLIRSEHVNDQAVREAKDAIAAAENALEDARAQLERRERAQYHEEQIWSDTIRRNSTWVTFGLMGLNIFLLLTSLVIFEPWRRRRMVREVKNALEAHKAFLEPTVAAAVPAVPAVAPESQIPAPTAAIESENNEATRPIEEVQAVEEVEAVEKANVTNEPTTIKTLAVETSDLVIDETATTQDEAPDTTTEPAVPGAAPLTPEGVVPQEAIDINEEVKAATDATPQTWQEKAIFMANDIVSERDMSMRRVDFTTAMLQSAAAGAVIAAAAIAIFLKPR